MISDEEFDENSEIDDESSTNEDDDELNHDQSSMQIEESKHETDKLKAEALKKQIALWDSFLELRIKLQRATINCNCLPTSIVTDDELQQVINENSKLFRKTLALLLAIEKRRSKKRGRDDDDDDDDNNESDVKDNKDTTAIFKKLSKRFKQDEQTIDDELNQTYEHFVPERDVTIQKWFERTRNFTKQNKTNLIEQSPMLQVKEIMSASDRLLKRTQTSRIDYDLICPPSSPENHEKPTQTNSELFDDGDFYHQLLREYIERKTASITDPEQISKHWAQLRKLRMKVKKNLDTKASKDRKIRYNVHQKLVNYMAPIDRCSFTDQAKSDLFSSLFGRTTIETQQTSPINDIRII